MGCWPLLITVPNRCILLLFEKFFTCKGVVTLRVDYCAPGVICTGKRIPFDSKEFSLAGVVYCYGCNLTIGAPCSESLILSLFLLTFERLAMLT